MDARFLALNEEGIPVLQLQNQIWPSQITKYAVNVMTNSWFNERNLELPSKTNADDNSS